MNKKEEIKEAKKTGENVEKNFGRAKKRKFQNE